ncbi:MAG: autotransporter-associated beta strand repeat-containing protein [Chthoniobacterales bacterium]|nr:autotransporter-associated beta strand repeat-containing protein [Chthoniobacterales bacterium]
MKNTILNIKLVFRGRGFFVATAMLLLLISSRSTTFAGSATWQLSPASGDWNTAANWMPNTVPDGPTDIATFDVSNTTSVSLSGTAEVDSIVFNPGASAFTITAGTFKFYNAITFSGTGIVNNSGTTQNFVTTGTTQGQIEFTGVATAGSATVFTNYGGARFSDTGVFFNDSSNAGSATFINNGGVDSNLHGTGRVNFVGSASAANGTFVTNPGPRGTFAGGKVIFSYSSTAANGTFVCNGGTAENPNGGYMQILDSATAAEGIFTINGSDFPGASPGSLYFYYTPTAGNATLIANGGTASGGSIVFETGSPDGGTSKVMLFGNGQLDIGYREAPGVTIGSLEGNGLVFLGANNLSIGSNELSTAFAGTIADGGIFGVTGGSLTKVGAGTLTLSGANTYTGGTTVSAGALKVDNKSSSASGAGAVRVDAGTLGGTGMIAGTVTVGTGSGAGAFLTPGQGARRPAALTIQSALTFKADATYVCTLNTKKAKADQVIANGITIESGAQFSLNAVAHKTLTAGQVFTAISNTSATPISGAFANLPDGSTFTADRNTFQVRYEGGDGNDLTLTVMPQHRTRARLISGPLISLVPKSLGNALVFAVTQP